MRIEFERASGEKIVADLSKVLYVDVTHGELFFTPDAYITVATKDWARVLEAFEKQASVPVLLGEIADKLAEVETGLSRLWLSSVAR